MVWQPVAMAEQQSRRFVLRKTNNSADIARDVAEENGSPALNGIATGLAFPLAAREVPCFFRRRDPTHPDTRPGEMHMARTVRRHQPDRRQDLMPTTGKQIPAKSRLLAGIRLGQDARPDSDDRIPGQHKTSRVTTPHKFGFFLRHPQGIGPRRFTPTRRFIHIGRVHRIRNNPDLRQKRDPARRCGRQNQALHHGHRTRRTRRQGFEAAGAAGAATGGRFTSGGGIS